MFRSAYQFSDCWSESGSGLPDELHFATRLPIESSATTVSLIEAGRFQPYPIQLAKLARALGVPEAEASILLHEDGADEARSSHSSTRGDAENPGMRR